MGELILVFVFVGCFGESRVCVLALGVWIKGGDTDLSFVPANTHEVQRIRPNIMNRGFAMLRNT